MTNINLEGDITPIAEGAKTNLEALPTGLDKLFCTIFGKKYAENKRHLALTGAQTQVDVQKIFDGISCYNGNEVVPNKQLHFTHQMAIEKEANIRACVLETVKNVLEEKTKTSDESISQKFFSIWREQAQHAYSVDEQALWGKVLSEENKQPGTFSLRTLDILKNMDKEYAEIFHEICDNVVSNSQIITGLKKEFGMKNEHSLIEMPKIKKMQNLGIIEHTHITDVKESQNGFCGFRLSNYIIVIKSEKNFLCQSVI